MSLPLSGQLGSAQLGAAQLGGIQSVSVGAGFPVFFPDSGRRRENADTRKGEETRGKARKRKKAKKSKKRKSVTIESAPAGELKDQPDLRVRTVVERPTAKPADPRPDTIIAADPFNTAEYLTLQADIYRQERLRETIAEDDELLLLLTS